jgi:ABC-type uncharacterized transport system substrate-binding protein
MRRFQTGVFWLSLSLISGVQAHPHIWVDLQITPLFNDERALIGLSQQWQFDPFYSLVLAEDIQHPDPQRPAQLKSDIWQNLEPQNFYTELRVADQPQELLPTSDLELKMDGFSAVLSFELTLSEPISAEQLNSADIRYQIFEPTYYMDMMHQSNNGLILSARAAHCDFEIVAAQPSAEKRQRAIDADNPEVSEDPTLGQHFAQTVILRCAD